MNSNSYSKKTIKLSENCSIFNPLLVIYCTVRNNLNQAHKLNCIAENEEFTYEPIFNQVRMGFHRISGIKENTIEEIEKLLLTRPYTYFSRELKTTALPPTKKPALPTTLQQPEKIGSFLPFFYS